MDDHIVIGIHVTDRVNKSVNIQQVLTEFGCHIKTRIGLHDVSADFCSPGGIILLEFLGSPETCEAFVEKLTAIEGVEAQTMVFKHD